MTVDLNALEEERERIIGCAIEVQRALGPGLLEAAYQRCLAIELKYNKIDFQVEPQLDVVYRGEIVERAYRPDLIVGKLVVVEIKVVEKLLPVHTAQVVTYLRLTGCPTGLIFNFHMPRLRDGGIKKVMHPSLYQRRTEQLHVIPLDERED